MATTRLFTVDELEQSSPEGEWELIDGELAPVNPSGFASSRMAHRVGRIIGNFVDDHDLGELTGSDGGYVLFPDRETLLAPDVAFVRKDRVPPVEEQGRFARLAPDLAVEILSPADRMASALAKVSLYLEAEVQMVWLIDPVKRTVTIFTPDDAPIRLEEGDTLTGGAILPGFSVQVGALLS
ncbi:MAG: Uma2 family endonuclease [Thermomicrobiales bacterium]|nr:Uma2 family endonuclease [Thermomicrobiales bacterium]